MTEGAGAANILQAELSELGDLQVALLDEVRRYRLLYDAAPVALVMTDHAGKIVDANRAASELLEVENRFLVGKPLLSFVDRDDRPRIRRFMLELIRGHERGVRRARMRRRTRVPFDAELRMTASSRELAWGIVDKTDEFQAEDVAWQLSRELDSRVAAIVGGLQDAYDELPIGVVVVDAETGETRSINKSAREMLAAWDGRLDAAERFDRNGEPLPADRWPATRALAGERVSHEVVVLRPGDRPGLVLDVSAVPVRGEDGAVRAAILSFDDLSERARKDEADARFVENAAHQLRTPITAIASAAAALQAGAKDDPASRDRFLAHIDRESERIGRLLGALLSLARLQRDNVHPTVSLVPLRPLLEGLAADAQPGKGVEVVVDCPAAVAVVADPALVREAVGNVLANAASHTQAGSITLAARLDGSTVVLDVADTGPGVPEKLRERIFERFYRAAPHRRSGAGLGLPIAAEATAANRGTLRLLPAEPGGGSTFRFELPGATLLA